MRVVFDTNILVAALVFPGGQGDAALRRVIDGTDQLLLSKAILDELLEVLGRKFAREAEELAHVAVFISELSTVVAPKRRLHIVKDDPDNRILECALAGGAHSIVTGDKALLALKSFEGIPVMTLASYLSKP
jgi:putative PIN family toxin of toxin-antitoxin system